jgi:ribulose-5-phosphate 4-epimerase/fuculose-1-phosphate aldolase
METSDTISNALRTDLDKLASACRILEMEGHGDMTLGHLSLRDPEGRGFWMKRNAIGLGEVRDAEDFVLVTYDGEQIAGSGRCHSEWPIHSEILLARPDINVVAHTHPYYTCVFSATDGDLRPVTLEASYFPDRIPMYLGTGALIKEQQMGTDLAKALGPALAVFMKNHGVTFCGKSTEAATLVGIWLERACKAQLDVTASSMDWSYPDKNGEAERNSQIWSDVHIEHSWGYYSRKLAALEAPPGGHPPALYGRPL